MRLFSCMFPALLLSASAAGVSAQDEATELRNGRAALDECVRYTEGPEELRANRNEGKRTAERAERAFRAVVTAYPKNPDAHVGLAEALSRCGAPYAGIATIMNVIEAAIRSLETALELAPTHWQARFVLALNYFHMPAFLNRNGDAIRELETLRAQQGGRADPPDFANTYLYLGDAYKRAGRTAEAEAAYAAGAKLFPEHADLQQRVTASGGNRDASSPSVAARAQQSGQTVYALTPLRVEAGQHQLEDARSGASLRRLDIYTMPGGTGEMMQTLQALPGATRAGDGADLYVRGGEAEETAVIVNGGRIAFPGRWESLNGSSMGVLDATLLSKAYFSAGGFSAKYGNALSGIVDVESRGRPSETGWRIGANLVSAGASLYRPLGASAGAWGNLTLTDVTLVSRMHGSASLYPDMPRSYQAAAGASFKPGATTEIKMLGLAAGDASSRIIDVGAYHGEFSSDGATQHGGVTGRWLRPDGRAAASASMTASRRNGGFRFGVLERDRTDEAFAARLDGDIVLAGGTRVRAGTEATQFRARTRGSVPLTPNLAPGSPTLELNGRREGDSHIGVYIEAEHALLRSLVGVAGIRADRLPGEGDLSLDPRFALAYTSRDWTLRAGGGVFHQGRWRRVYRLPDAGAPSGVPTRARHMIAGVERGGEPAIRVDVYAKLYDRYTPGDGGGPSIAAGTALGMDAMIRLQRRSRLNGWITYSVLDADVTLHDGRTVDARYDVTHSLTSVARFALNDAWELGGALRLATGKPYTPILGSRPSTRHDWPLEPVYGDVNAERLPHYGRLDGRVTRYQPIGGGLAVFYLEMLDLTGRRNVMGYQYDASYTKRLPLESFFARRTFVLGAEVQF